MDTKGRLRLPERLFLPNRLPICPYGAGTIAGIRGRHGHSALPFPPSFNDDFGLLPDNRMAGPALSCNFLNMVKQLVGKRPFAEKMEKSPLTGKFAHGSGPIVSASPSSANVAASIFMFVNQMSLPIMMIRGHTFKSARTNSTFMVYVIRNIHIQHVVFMLRCILRMVFCR